MRTGQGSQVDTLSIPYGYAVSRQQPWTWSWFVSYPGIELVNSQSTYIAWHWVDPREEDLVAAEAIEGYKGTVQIAQGCEMLS